MCESLDLSMTIKHVSKTVWGRFYINCKFREQLPMAKWNCESSENVICWIETNFSYHIYIYMYIYIYMCVCVCVCVSKDTWRLRLQSRNKTLKNIKLWTQGVRYIKFHAMCTIIRQKSQKVTTQSYNIA